MECVLQLIKGYAMVMRILMCMVLPAGLATFGCKHEKPLTAPTSAAPEEAIGKEQAAAERPKMTDKEMRWTPFKVETADGTIECSLSKAEVGHNPPTICMILYSGSPVERLARGGADVLRVPHKWGNLNVLAEGARAGQDVFAEATARLDAAISRAIEAGLAKPGRIVLMGSSCDGFMALDAMAHIPAVGAAIANQTVTYWPYLGEFKGMDDNPIVQKHDLRQMVHRMAPRPVLLQIGYNDERVGTERCRELAACIEKAYKAVGAGDRCALQVLSIKGHTSSPGGEDHDYLLKWLHEQGFVRAE